MIEVAKVFILIRIFVVVWDLVIFSKFEVSKQCEQEDEDDDAVLVPEVALTIAKVVFFFDLRQDFRWNICVSLFRWNEGDKAAVVGPDGGPEEAKLPTEDGDLQVLVRCLHRLWEGADVEDLFTCVDDGNASFCVSIRGVKGDEAQGEDEREELREKSAYV